MPLRLTPFIRYFFDRPPLVFLPVALSCLSVSCSRPRICTELADLGDYRVPEEPGERKCGFVTLESGEKALHGPFQILSKDGKLTVTGQFYEGKKTGKWTTFDVQGKIKDQRDFGSVATPSHGRN